MSEEVTFDKYVLDRRLAVGGMAEVFLAHVDGPEGFQKRVVVKRILPDCVSDQDHVKMFLSEARLVARFNHPNLIHVYQLVESEGQYGLAMEYIEGVDLWEVFKRSWESESFIPYDIVAYIIAEAAEGLHYAHQLIDDAGESLGVVHRDISLGNIIVTWNGIVKVVDFGVAKHTDRDLKTRAGVLKGKFSYMSPEQVDGDPLDGRSDIYALGTVFYELLTLTRCFRRESDYETLEAVRLGAYRPVRAIREDVPDEIVAILSRTLAVSLDERYADAKQLSKDLRRFLATTTMPAAEEVCEFLEGLFANDDKTEVQAVLPFAGDDVIPVSARNAPPDRQLTRGEHDAIIANAEAGKTVVLSDRGERLTDTEPDHFDPAWPDLSVGASEEVTLDDPLRAEGGTKVDTEPGFQHRTKTQTDTVTERIRRVVEHRPWTLGAGGAGVGALIVVLALVFGDWGGGRDPEVEPEPDAEPAAVSGAELGPDSFDTIVESASGEAEDLATDDDLAVEEAVEAEQDAASPPAAEGGGRDGPKAKRRRPSGKKGKARSPPRAAAPAADKQEGNLTVTSTPRLDVYLEGRKLGKTPLRNHSLDPGLYTLTLRDDDRGINRTFAIKVDAGGTVKKNLTIGQGTVKLEVKPWATVYIDNRRMGTTPIPAVKLYEGRHKIRLRNSELGGKERVIVVDVKPGKTETVKVDLSK